MDLSRLWRSGYAVLVSSENFPVLFFFVVIIFYVIGLLILYVAEGGGFLSDFLMDLFAGSLISVLMWD